MSSLTSETKIPEQSSGNDWVFLCGVKESTYKWHMVSFVVVVMMVSLSKCGDASARYT